MKQKDWKIIYTKYEGILKRAVNLLSRDAGALLIREPHVYRIYVLPCEKEGCAISKNAFFVGCYDDSKEIQKYVAKEEVPADGFFVKVMKNPEDEEGRFVILTAHSEAEVFSAVVSFIDDYIPEYVEGDGTNRMVDLIFDKPLKECAYSQSFDHKTRSIFTWGHSINSSRAYIDNMARLRFNELILWNDYIPINIDEIIDYAHSYGIKVVLGYSWGWKEIGNKVAEITDDKIEEVKRIALEEYKNNYARIKCDGIYFQSFTERKEEALGGKLISRMVVDMVNDIAAKIWEITPGIRIIFGLHATSVRTRLDEIARVDERMDILWEDCGSFPFNYSSYVKDEEKYTETLEFVKQILELRSGKGVGLAFKGVMMLDWTQFINQHGPYVMGENSPEIAAHDRLVRAKAWREFSGDWLRYGDRAQQMLKWIKEKKLDEIDMCIAGTFDGGIYLPFALAAEMFKDCEGEYGDILRRPSRRACITTD